MNEFINPAIELYSGAVTNNNKIPNLNNNKNTIHSH